MNDISKENIIGHCRGDVVETLVLKFNKLAERSDASSLEVLVAAVTFAKMAAEFIPNPQQRTAMLDALVGASLQ